MTQKLQSFLSALIEKRRSIKANVKPDPENKECDCNYKSTQVNSNLYKKITDHGVNFYERYYA